MKKTILITLLGMVLFSCNREKIPNIIYIYTDQQSETMMNCAGNEYLKTPAMDYIANNGIRFTRVELRNRDNESHKLKLLLNGNNVSERAFETGDFEVQKENEHIIYNRKRD